MFSNLVERAIYFLFEVQEDWQVGIIPKKAIDFISTNNAGKVKWIDKSRNVFQADPFGVYVNNRYYLYLEELDKQKGYGYIRCKVLDNNLQVIEDEIVIDEGIHFSFPFILEYGGEYFMLPETIAKGRLVLYKAKNNNLLQWSEYKTLLSGAYMDSFVFPYNNSWWLFYSKADEHGNDIFYIRNAPDLFSDWNNCEELAIHNGPRNSRAGGSVIMHEDVIYRVSQNCALKYGGSVIINRIENLAIKNYKEVELRELNLPPPYTLAFHTVSECADITFVDGKRRKLYLKSPKGIINTIRRKLNKA